ncbi:phage major capsid protein [Arthrobacter sp. KBS0703]|uniref:phage major capsid protein n=1 Tax=Arthrobacter sp. KBS0703 TaxID=1955698 RepID=UPI00163D8162|nr:phage major capsid protein [Arthrobacter sp. KBS0703]
MNFARKQAALGPLEEEMTHWEQEMTSWEIVESKKRAFDGAGGREAMGADHSGGYNVPAVDAYGHPVPQLRRAPNLIPDPEQMRELYEAASSQRALRIQIKSPSSDAGNVTAGQLPAQLYPGITGMGHEPVRILDHIPTTSMQGAPSIEFISHTSTTGTAGMVAAGAQKPEATITTTQVVLTAKKLAVYALENMETLADFPAFQQYLTAELSHLVIDQENTQVLTGDGTGQNLLGLLNWSGIITRAYGTATETQGLDTIDLAIADLRTGPAFTEPDTVIIHPATWSKLRRVKDSQGRYLLNPDPTAAEANTLWGVPVLATTSIATGTAVVANLAAAAVGFVREGISIQTSNAHNDAFRLNQIAYVVEERLQLGVSRPAGIVKVTGL